MENFNGAKMKRAVNVEVSLRETKGDGNCEKRMYTNANLPHESTYLSKIVMLSSMLVLAGTGIVGSTLKKCTISRFQYQLLKWFIELSNTRGEVK